MSADLKMFSDSQWRSFPLFGALEKQPGDFPSSLSNLHRADRRAKKLNLATAGYRDEDGTVLSFRASNLAEESLAAAPRRSGYLGPAGDAQFISLLKSLIFGKLAISELLWGVQTPGATGALRLAAELVALAKPDARIWVGTPEWSRHPAIIAAAGLSSMSYSFFDVGAQTVRFDRMMSALASARAGDVVLLQGCCHNPTGADLKPAEWTALAEMMASKGLVPLFDLAYHGFGMSLEADANGVRTVLNRVGEALVAYSCAKNFGLYQERPGALFVLSGSRSAKAAVHSTLLSLVRANWGIPPCHGAAIVKTVLASGQLRGAWEAELATARLRLQNLRSELASAVPRFASVAGHTGLFALLPITPETVVELRERNAIYLAVSGRINLSGLSAEKLMRFKLAVAPHFRAEVRQRQRLGAA